MAELPGLSRTWRAGQACRAGILFHPPSEAKRNHSPNLPAFKQDSLIFNGRIDFHSHGDEIALSVRFSVRSRDLTE
jgi:hypothetical protein